MSLFKRARQVVTRAVMVLALVFVGFNGGACLAASKLDLNSATMKQLEQVKGIGPVRAKEIIRYRQAHHGFKSVKELEKVKGIGPKTVSRLSEQLTVSGAEKADKN